MTVTNLLKRRFYLDNDYDIVIWDGQKDSTLFINITEPSLRKDYLSYNVVLAGSFKMFSPSGVERWGYKVGDTSDSGGDFDEVGMWRWVAQEDDSAELCMSTREIVNGRLEEADHAPRREVVDAKKKFEVIAPAGSIVIIPKGSFQTSKGVVSAPAVIKVTNEAKFTALEDSRLVQVRK